MKAISDAGSLIILARAGLLKVMRESFSLVCIPSAVWNEINADGGTRPRAMQLQASQWLTHLQHPPVGCIHGLGAGESHVLFLAKHLAMDLVILDDRAARNEAERRGLKVIGTLGILAAGHRNGWVLDLSLALDAVQESGLHVSERLIERILAESQ